MSTEVIYARVPEPLKKAAESYADVRGVTLTSAVTDLLERGLLAVADEPSVANLEKRLAKVTAEKSQVVGELQGARAELGALSTFTRRADRVVGKCPHPGCGTPISGFDLLGSGHCPSSNCGESLSTLIAPPTQSSSLDQREMMILIGALGAVLGLGYLASK